VLISLLPVRKDLLVEDNIPAIEDGRCGEVPNFVSIFGVKKRGTEIDAPFSSGFKLGSFAFFHK
jgi:hypothetical protein